MVRDLKVVLSIEELLRKGAEMAEIQRSKELKEEEKKSTAKALGVEIEALEKKQSALSLSIRDKCEMRSVVCRTEKDFIHKEILVIRSDNDEVIERHPMTASDLQQSLPIEEAKAADTEEKKAEEKIDDGSIATPCRFEECDVGQVWHSGKFGEGFIIAKANDSVVADFGGTTSRIFAETWVSYEMTFVKFCDKPSEDGLCDEPIALLAEANPDPTPGHIWAVNGFEVEIKSLDAEKTLLVRYLSDDSTSYYSSEEWVKSGARFVRSVAVVEKPKTGKSKKRAKKADQPTA